MKWLSLPASCAAIVLLTAPSAAVDATSGLQRCVGSDGSTAYTDRACKTLGATASPLPKELITRISREEAAMRRQNLDAVDDRSLVVGAARRSPTSGCARSKKQLSLDLQGSLAMHSVNRLAESYHWVGKSNQQAKQYMQQLEDLAEQRLMDAQLFDASIGTSAMQLSDKAVTDGAIVQLSFGKDSVQQVLDLEVMRYAGCYFVKL